MGNARQVRQAAWVALAVVLISAGTQAAAGGRKDAAQQAAGTAELAAAGTGSNGGFTDTADGNGGAGGSAGAAAGTSGAVSSAGTANGTAGAVGSAGAANGTAGAVSSTGAATDTSAQGAAVKVPEFTDRKPGYGEGGGAGAGNLPVDIPLEPGVIGDTTVPIITTVAAVERTGTLKVKGKGAKQVASLKVKKDKTYTLNFAAMNRLVTAEEIAALKNKTVTVTGHLPEPDATELLVLHYTVAP